ncbi:MAG: hypothetical protein AAFO77_02495, partial [Pseudomonadota bacterium]
MLPTFVCTLGLSLSLPLLLSGKAHAAETLLDWSSRPAVNLETTATDTATVDGITVTTSGTEVGSRTSDTLALQPTTTSNGFSGVIASAVNATIDNESVFQRVTFSFSEPVYNLRFTTADIDRVQNTTAQFTDLITFGSDNGPPIAQTTGSQVSYNATTGRAISNGDPDCNGDLARCQITVLYPQPVSTVTWRHVAADVINLTGPSNSTNQAVQIRDLFFNTPPDATNNTAATLSTAAVVGNVLSDDDGFGVDSDRQDGANLTVNQISHPDATVTVSGTSILTLANGATLTIDEDGNYAFDPNGAYAGLAAGATTIETFTYRIEDEEGLFNTDGDTIRPDSVGTLTVTITGSATPVPAFTIFKSVDQSAITAPGTLNYTITLNNTGSVDLTGVSLNDTISQGTNVLSLASGPTLSSGDIDGDNVLDTTETWVYTATFNATQANVDDGDDILNIATAGTNETGSQTSVATATTSTPGPTFACAGDDFANANLIAGISGSTVCTNTGASGETDEPLTFGGGQLETIWYEWTAPISGTATFDTCVATTNYDTTLGVYTGSAVNALTTVVTNDDGAACSNFRSELSFAATAGTTYFVQVGGFNDSDGTFQLNWNMAAPAMSVVKSAGQSQITSPGVLSYTILVDNTGTVDLTGVAVVDTLTQDATSLPLASGPVLTAGDLDNDGTLDTNETWAYTVTYNVTQADIDDGSSLNNLASVSTNELGAQTSAVVTPIIQNPDLLISKSSAFVTGSSPAGVGDVIRYTYVVENTGNVTISNVNVTDVHNGTGIFPTSPGNAVLTDNAPTGDSTGTAGGTVWASLAPGDLVTFQEDYSVTQLDIDTL